MPQVSAISAAATAAAARTPRTTPGDAATPAPAQRMPEDEKMGMVAYLLQGGAFLAFLLVLFMLAGFRG